MTADAHAHGQEADDIRARVADVPYWYHTMELGPGVVTPGHFDMRQAVSELPWPDLTGKRCLDVATFDGFYAFEMERRGAAEVVAIDIEDSADLDWLPRQTRPKRGTERIGLGFQLARQQLQSRVKRVPTSVYALTPEDHGQFDFVVCGALLQHLRDPVLALERIRSVCRGEFMSVERVDTPSSLTSRRPLQSVRMSRRTWSIPNVSGHRTMLRESGFDIVATSLLGMPHGPTGQPHLTGTPTRIRHALARAGWWLLVRSPNPPFSVVLGRPTSST